MHYIGAKKFVFAASGTYPTVYVSFQQQLVMANKLISVKSKR